VKRHKSLQAERYNCKLGYLLRVVGKVTIRDGFREIKVTQIVLENDIYVEMLHWLEVVSLTRDVYKKPFFKSKLLDQEENSHEENTQCALELVGHHNLTKDVFQVIKLIPQGIYGVKLFTIIKSIQSIPQYKFIQISHILQSIIHLVASSLVYQVSRTEFKAM